MMRQEVFSCKLAPVNDASKKLAILTDGQLFVSADREA